MDLANIAATNAEHLCTCRHHGYSQYERHGRAELGSCFVECEGHVSEFYKGDRDCSSAVIDAWQEALLGTDYAGALDGATYTGNMRQVFVASGLFDWKPMSYIAQRGDIYLNERNHTAMCVSAVPDTLAEFSASENGTISGVSGDQTGRESSIHAYYDYPWDGILAYNHKGDTPKQNPRPETVAEPRIRVYTREYGWLEWVSRHGCEDGCGDDFAGVSGCWIYGVDAVGCGTVIAERSDGTKDGGEPKGSPVTGIHLTGDVRYQAHWLGSSPAWGKVEHADDDDGAGKDADSPLDMIRLV